MQSQVIMSGGPYRLVSYGNGWAYDLQNWSNDQEPGTPWTVFVQDDDATQMREEIESIESMHPTMPARDVLGMIWSNYWQGESA